MRASICWWHDSFLDRKLARNPATHRIGHRAKFTDGRKGEFFEDGRRHGRRHWRGRKNRRFDSAHGRIGVTAHRPNVLHRASDDDWRRDGSIAGAKTRVSAVEGWMSVATSVTDWNGDRILDRFYVVLRNPVTNAARNLNRLSQALKAVQNLATFIAGGDSSLG